MIGGTGVIFACEVYIHIKVPISAMSTFLQNEELSLTIGKHAIKYIRLEGGGNL